MSTRDPLSAATLIVWQRCAAGGTCDIWAYDWATGVTTQITDTSATNERNPDVDGTTIVYQGDRTGDSDIYLYDLATGTEQHLALAGDQANPHVSGEFVSMDDLSGGIYHIRLWHYPTGAVFDVTGGTAGQYLNDIDGNRVVYTDDRNGDLEIYMVTFQVTQSDTTPPTIMVPGTVTVDATGPGGAVAGYSVTVTDDTDPAPVLSCAPAAGACSRSVTPRSRALRRTRRGTPRRRRSLSTSPARRSSSRLCGATSLRSGFGGSSR